MFINIVGVTIDPKTMTMYWSDTVRQVSNWWIRGAVLHVTMGLVAQCYLSFYHFETFRKKKYFATKNLCQPKLWVILQSPDYSN